MEIFEKKNFSQLLLWRGSDFDIVKTCQIE